MDKECQEYFEKILPKARLWESLFKRYAINGNYVYDHCLCCGKALRIYTVLCYDCSRKHHDLMRKIVKDKKLEQAFDKCAKEYLYSEVPFDEKFVDMFKYAIEYYTTHKDKIRLYRPCILLVSEVCLRCGSKGKYVYKCPLFCRECNDSKCRRKFLKFYEEDYFDDLMDTFMVCYIDHPRKDFLKSNYTY